MTINEPPLPEGKWTPAYIMTANSSNSLDANASMMLKSGTSTPTSGTVSPNGMGGFINTPNIQTWPQPMTAWPVADEEDDECEAGHLVDADTIQVRDEGITGRCSACDALIWLPHVIGALAFERAGAAVGRAMTLHDGDDEKIGHLLADLRELERAAKADIARLERALGMLDIAKDLVEQRAVA